MNNRPKQTHKAKTKQHYHAIFNYFSMVRKENQMKLTCKNCANRKKCNTLDRSRNTICKDFKAKENKQ